MVKTLQKGSDTEDGYAKAIEFSNACRQFYINRKKITENFKESIERDKTELKNVEKTQTSMFKAMDKLRSEMASLMDLDLSLMEQLLTLNETIEDMKSRRIQGRNMSMTSSCFLSREDWANTDTIGSKPEVTQACINEERLVDDVSNNITKKENKVTPSLTKSGTDQQSFDSGCGDELPAPTVDENS